MSTETDPPAAPAPLRPDDLSPLAPLRRPVFRMLWLTGLSANVCMWMNDVAAAWMMTSLTTVPIWVALVQTASTLPVFLFGLPSGALADILDRKRYYLTTQLWLAGIGLVLCAATLAQGMTPLLLLALTFANGIGLAMRWPVFAAIVPELVPRAQLPAALGLGGISMNASRIIGPLVAGGLIASVGSASVFLLNAVLCSASAWLVSRWQRDHQPNPLGRERLGSAMRVGWQFVAQSYHLKGVMLRIGVFFFCSSGLMALLALVARGMHGGNAGTFTLLLAAMGAGAIVATLNQHRVRKLWSRDGLLARGAALQGLVMILVAFTHETWIAAPALFVGGMAWITTANSLSVAAQMGLPDWVRARGMAMYQMAIMGSSAAGSAIWGQVATSTNVAVSLAAAGLTCAFAMAAVNRWRPDRGMEDDLAHRGPLGMDIPAPQASAPPERGHVLVMVEYRIDPARAAEFRALMQESRSRRLSHGALSWDLLHDLNEPGRFVEVIEDESWNDHLRRFSRVTAADVALRDRKLAFHLGPSAPVITRVLRESTLRD